MANTPSSSVWLKMQFASLRACKDLFQRDVRAIIYELPRRWIPQLNTIEGMLLNDNVRACTGFAQEMLSWPSFSRHPPKDDLTFVQRAHMPVFVGLLLLLGEDLFLMAI